VEPTTDAPTSARRRLWTVLTGDDTVTPLTALAWLALIVLLLVRTVDVAANDFREHTIAGDQVSFLWQAQSLANSGHDLTYDQADFERFADLDWGEQPSGLFFQRYQDGWAFAKPYGYSLMAAPALAVFGDVRGMAVANAFLLLALTAVIVAILRTRYRGAVVPLVTGAFLLVAQPYLYAYVLHAELFLALLTAVTLGLVLWYWRSGNVVLALLAFAGMAFGVSEKPPMLALFLPVVVLVLVQQRGWWPRLGATWNPYSGERYAAALGVPFDGQATHAPRAWRNAERDRYFTTDVIDRAVNRSPNRLEILAWYFFGRHTGLLVFLPTGLFLLVAALARWRHLDARAWAVLGGIVGYILFYVLLLPRAYVGGASLGNRYFLQIAPSIIVAAVLAQVSARAAMRAGIAGAVLGTVLLWPHHADPSAAYAEQLSETSPLQRLFPAESDIFGSAYFECPYPYQVECVRKR
jgi:hypothetical protein